MQKKRKRWNDPIDPATIKRPEPGSAVAGRGKGGKIGVTGGTLLTQYVLKNQGMLKNPAEEDVRAAILRHADKQDKFSAFTAAYAKTQPTPIFQHDTESEGEEGG